MRGQEGVSICWGTAAATKASWTLHASREGLRQDSKYEVRPRRDGDIATATRTAPRRNRTSWLVAEKGIEETCA